jgi:RHS repeat-associated protein
MIHSQRGSKEALFIFEPSSFVPLATIQGAANHPESRHTYWYQCDQIGAPQELTDAQGRIVWAADYKVWGEAKLRAIEWPMTGTDGGAAGRGSSWHTNPSASPKARSEAPLPIEQPFRFQGQQFDEETGLHYNRFRYYDPVVGRFASQDPIGLAGGFNLFVYGPNPLRWIDVFGLAATCNCPIPHICTDKNEKSSARGGPWTPRFKEIFDKAGYGLDTDINKIGIPGHAGPHPETYHSAVFERLQSATQGKSGEAYKKAFEAEMGKLKNDVADPNHMLNKLVCKK